MSRRNGDASTLRSVAFEVLVDEVESMDMSRDPTVDEHTAESALYLRPLGSERGERNLREYDCEEQVDQDLAYRVVDHDYADWRD